MCPKVKSPKKYIKVDGKTVFNPAYTIYRNNLDPKKPTKNPPVPETVTVDANNANNDSTVDQDPSQAPPPAYIKNADGKMVRNPDNVRRKNNDTVTINKSEPSTRKESSSSCSSSSSSSCSTCSSCSSSPSTSLDPDSWRSFVRREDRKNTR